MPGFEGPLLAERITALKPGLPIVRMSGSDQSAGGGQLGGDPAGAFLPKPFTAEHLIRVVRDALAARLIPAHDRGRVLPPGFRVPGPGVRGQVGAVSGSIT